MTRRSWLFGSLSLVVTEAAAAEPDAKFQNPAPSASATLVISRGHNWTIEELHKKSIEFLVTSGTLPTETKVQAIVHVLPDDKKTMCEFLYVQGFNQPYWKVSIGYDGKVAGYEKRVKREG